MAKFRDSVSAKTIEEPVGGADEGASSLQDRSIGDIISETRNLSVQQVEQILTYQREHGVRFGEAAVALKLVSTEDVLFALAQQFHYPYAPEERRTSSPELVTLNQPFSAQAEAFRAMRSQVMMRIYVDGEPRKALAIISPAAKDGKSFFCANLAVSFAQLGGRTLVVDADMRGPRQHEIFGVENKAGLSSILSGRTEAQVIQRVGGVGNLFVLPVGVTPPNPLELVERSAFGLLMRELAGKFDHVVVDTPASMYGADSAVIAARCGAALVLARKNESSVSALQELVGSLDGTPAQLAGAIVNEF